MLLRSSCATFGGLRGCHKYRPAEAGLVAWPPEASFSTTQRVTETAENAALVPEPKPDQRHPRFG